MGVTERGPEGNASSEAREPFHLRAGRWGEQEAARHLKRKGYRILGERVRVGRKDEVDLIVRDGSVLVFVEVKTRGSERFGRPWDAVDREKRRTLSRAAVTYLKQRGFPQICFRFDVVEVIGDPDRGPDEIRHIENAFPLDRRYQLPC